MFQVPSTPDSCRQSGSGPSTTPAGPPPSSFTAQSFTPAGPPPSSVFGSSFAGQTGNLTNSRPAFAPSGHLNSPSLKSALHTNPLDARVPQANARNGFSVPDSSPPRYSDEDDEDEEDVGDYSEDADGESVDQMDGMEGGQERGGRRSPMGSARESIETPADMYSYQSPRGSERSRNGNIVDPLLQSSRLGGWPQSRDSNIPGIAKGIASSIPAAKSVQEPDELVLSTESALSALDGLTKAQQDHEKDVEIGAIATNLKETWDQYVEKQSLPASVGPVQKSGLSRATYLASLLLQLHHPTSADAKLVTRNNASFRASHSRSLARKGPSVTPLPKALLDWLNEHHNPYPDDLSEVLNCKPSPTAHERFWDLVFQIMLRGDLETAIRLLDTANFAHADTAIEDGYSEPGYKGRQLEAVQSVVASAVQLLQSCPAVMDGDWDVRNTDWALFRNRVRRTLEDLESFAEDASADRNAGGRNVFQSGLGQSRDSLSFSTASRRAESKVPWTVYEQLKTLYSQLLGQHEEILLASQDWLEASIYLTAWWDGEDDRATGGSLAASRRSMRQSMHARPVDVSPLAAYRARLLSAYADVTAKPEDPALGVNTIDPVQVGLACIFEEDIEGVMGLLRRWSMPIAASVVDVASAAAWLPESRPRSRGMMDAFDQSDLMVLSHGQTQRPNGFHRDDVLVEYADLLAPRDAFSTSDGSTVREGWELAISVLSRLDSADTAQRKIEELLDTIALDSTEKVDKVLEVCDELGLAQQVRTISERYANNLAESSHSYGDAIVYYARAHAVRSLQSNIDLLISMSLVQSTAYPPAPFLDPQLSDLLYDQHKTLSQLARTDTEAAQLIAQHLSGYATLRRFYDLRDEGDEEAGVKKSGLRLQARKREAARAILGLIESASACIHGGLFDAEVNGVVQVDTLLALLGEALPLMDGSKSQLKQPQLITLMRAIEDLETVTSRIYEQVETLFQAAMSDYHGNRTASPKDLAKSLSKSVANLSGSTYGLVNSNGSIESANDSASASQEQIRRGWDWRKGIALMAGKSAKGSDVLRVLRVQIAKEMAKCWAQDL